MSRSGIKNARRNLKQRPKCSIMSEITNWGRRGSVLVTGITLDNPARVSKSHLDSANKWRPRLRTFSCYFETEYTLIELELMNFKPVGLFEFQRGNQIVFMQKDTHFAWSSISSSLPFPQPNKFSILILFSIA